MKFELIQFTALYAGLLGLFYVGLSFRVIGLRKKHKIGINHGEEMELARAIRVHANFAEYVPIALILILLLELNQTSNWLLHVLGASLLIGRVLHSMGLSKSAGTSAPRFIGMILTFLMIIVASALNVLAVY